MIVKFILQNISILTSIGTGLKLIFLAITLLNFISIFKNKNLTGIFLNQLT